MSTAYTGEKVKMSFWQIWNMCFGFFGIQFGWSLQMGNMSAIYEFLGASPDEIPGLWLAAPMTGLIVQPIVGYFSDRTWHPKLGSTTLIRRRQLEEEKLDLGLNLARSWIVKKLEELTEQQLVLDLQELLLTLKKNF